jgi:hypothetical protein
MYLEFHGRKSLDDAAHEYDKALRILGIHAESMPAIDFDLVQEDDRVRRTIQRQKLVEWHKFRSIIDIDRLNAIEPRIKRSVSAAMDALNYLEDHPLREVAHAAIHRAAFVKRGLFGCPITYGKEEGYWTESPINITHLRMGVSAGLVSDFECSICGSLVEDCDHRIGELYPKLATRDSDGRCTVCGKTECNHSEGATIMVTARANARNARVTEVSMVARPRYPLARIVAKSYDIGPVGEDPNVRAAAQEGALNCDGDLGPCMGFNEMSTWNLTSISSSVQAPEQPSDST